MVSTGRSASQPSGRDALFVVGELSELRAAALTYWLDRRRDSRCWYFTVEAVNRDLVSGSTVQAALPDAFVAAPERAVPSSDVHVFGFANKLTSPDREPVETLFSYYEVAACVGRGTALPLLSRESINRRLPPTYVTVSNLKLREPEDPERFGIFLEAVSEMPYFFVVVPRHRLSDDDVPKRLPPNCFFDNRSGVLLDHFSRSSLAIHGNCITFDDSEHSPYESTLRSYALVNPEFCTKSEYQWMYESGLTRAYSFGTETLERTIADFTSDPALESRLASKDQHVERNAARHMRRFYRALDEQA